MRNNTFLARAIVLVTLIACGARGDVVQLSDGSRLVGKVEVLADGKVAIVTSFAGRIELDASTLVGIETDEPVHVMLDTGDTLIGPLASAESGQAVVSSAVGAVSVDVEKLHSVWPQGAESPQERTARLAAEERIAAVTPKWSVTLEGGVIRKEGNTDTLEGHGRFQADRKTKDDLLRFYLRGTYKEDSDVRSENEYLGGIRYENSLSERWYWYARTELEFDEFEQIDLRATAAAGVGYYWIRKPKHELKTNIGPGYRHETYENGDTEDDFVLDLGLDYRLDITPWAQFTHSTVYSPNLEEFDNYRLNFDTGLLVPFKDDRWAWKVGMRNDYNSRPASGNERLDNTYYTSIVLKLE